MSSLGDRVRGEGGPGLPAGLQASGMSWAELGPGVLPAEGGRPLRPARLGGSGPPRLRPLGCTLGCTDCGGEQGLARPGHGHQKLSVQVLPLVLGCRQCPHLSEDLGRERLWGTQSGLGAPAQRLWATFSPVLALGNSAGGWSLGSLRPPSRPPPAPPRSACGRRPPEAGQS